MSAGFAQVIVGVALPTFNGRVPLLLAPYCVPLIVLAENAAATLCVATVSAEGLYVVKLATPPALVTAEPTAVPSTVKLTVAPTTPALVSFRVSVAVSVTGPVDPNATEFGLTLFSTSVVGTVPGTTTRVPLAVRVLGLF